MPGADLLALDDAATLHAIRWLEPEEWSGRLADLLDAHDSLRRDAARLTARLSARLPPAPPAAEPPAPPPPAWIYVGLRPPEHWAAHAALLNFPVRFVKVHPLTSGEDGVNVVYFELLEPAPPPEPARAAAVIESIPCAQDRLEALGAVLDETARAQAAPGDAAELPPGLAAALDEEEIRAFTRLHRVLEQAGPPW